MKPTTIDTIQGIFWLKLGDGQHINLASLSSCEVAKQDHGNKLTLKYATRALEFYGEKADAILDRLKLLSDPTFTDAYYRLALNEAPKGNAKKRGSKQKPETKEKLEMLSKGVSVKDIAEFYGDKEFPRLKAVYLSEGETEDMAERFAKADLRLWKEEEKARLRSLRSDYDLNTFQRKRRKKNRQIPTKGTQIL